VQNESNQPNPNRLLKVPENIPYFQICAHLAFWINNRFIEKRREKEKKITTTVQRRSYRCSKANDSGHLSHSLVHIGKIVAQGKAKTKTRVKTKPYTGTAYEGEITSNIGRRTCPTCKVNAFFTMQSHRVAFNSLQNTHTLNVINKPT
jgi:hypothetical protein